MTTAVNWESAQITTENGGCLIGFSLTRDGKLFEAALAFTPEEVNQKKLYDLTNLTEEGKAYISSRCEKIIKVFE